MYELQCSKKSGRKKQKTGKVGDDDKNGDDDGILCLTVCSGLVWFSL